MTLTASAPRRTSAPATSRPDLPSGSATRLRRPSWRDPRLLAGVVLVTASVVGGAKLITSFDDTSAYYRTVRPLTPGQPITADDVAVVDARLGDAGSPYVAGGTEVIGSVVTRTVPAGELLPIDAVGRPDLVAVAPIGIPVPLATSKQLRKGDVVDVWVAAADSEKSGQFGQPARVVAGATVNTVGEGGSTFSVGSEATVGVLIPGANLIQVLDALANGAKVTLVPAPGSIR